MTSNSPELVASPRRSASESANSIRGSLGDIKESVGEIVQAEREMLKEGIQRGKERVISAKSGVVNYVRENPGQSLMIAVGTGAVVGYLLGRRR